MAAEMKEAAILQISSLLYDKEKDLSQYHFEDSDGFSLYIRKNDGIRMLVSLIGFEHDDVVNESYKWQSHKENIIELFHKLNNLYEKILREGSNRKDDRIDIVFSVDIFMPKSLIEFFIKESDGLTIVNPIAFSRMNLYIFSFKDITSLKKFIESKIFCKIKSIVC